MHVLRFGLCGEARPKASAGDEDRRHDVYGQVWSGMDGACVDQVESQENKTEEARRWYSVGVV